MKITNFNPRYSWQVASGTASGGSAPGFLTNTSGGQGVVDPLSTLGSTEVINVGSGNYFTGTLDANTAISFTGWPASGVYSEIGLRLTENGTGGWTPSFSGVTWVGGTTPTHTTTANTVTDYIFWTTDGGSTVYGGQVGAAGASSSSITAAVEAAHVHAINEEHTGDGTSTVYTLGNAAEPYTLAAYVSGLRMDVTLSGTNDTVTFPGPPAVMAPIRFDYIAELSP